MKTKPFSKTKSIVTYVVCGVLIVALAIGNYYASLYKDLITVYTSGSDVVTTDESAKVCQTIEEEGMVLLKNEDGLPLKEGAKVSLLGQDSVDFVYGGSGSGSVDTSLALNLKEAMEASGFDVNETLWDFYDSGAGKDYRKSVPDETGAGEFAVNEVPASVYTDDVKDSFKDYNDAAIVCIGRSGGESADIPTEPLASGYKYLELDQDERDMLTMACQNFDNVVVLVNANNAMELGFLNDEAYKNVKACVWVGGVGQEGIKAVAEALAGKTNFSGHLADTYAYDSQSAPSIENIGDFTITNSDVTNGNKYTVYSEGIYVGYRYYETRYEDTVLGTAGVGNYDYASTVKYPFGYGLSYTNFAYSNFSAEEKDDSFDLHVTVTNTGDVAGKDVVEAYFQSPYTDYDKENGIEKSAVELCGFDKTKELKPGESQNITISVDKKELRTYDSNNAKTYILDAGDYYFTAATDVHEALNNILAAKAADGVSVNTGAMTSAGDATFTYKWTNEKLDDKTYSVSNDGEENYEITNQFDGADLNKIDDGAQSITYVSRSNWADTMPTEKATLALSQSMHDEMTGIKEYVPEKTDEEMPTMGKSGSMTLAQMIGKDYDDPDWDELLDQLTYEEMTELIGLGYHSTAAIASVAKPATVDENGPQGFTKKLSGVGGSICAYTDENIMAATWNVELMEEVGQHIGEDTMAAGGSGLYGPAMNTHRSPYAGRDFEYYSEDGFLAGKIAAAEVTGIQSKGVYVYIKHFALNDSETKCRCISTFANEQSIREIYLQPFEHAVIEGGAYNVMNAFARIGVTWCGASKNLMTNVLRNEWGLRGFGITDYSTTGKTYNVYLGVMAGTDTWDSSSADTWQKRLLNHEEDNDVALTLAMREASHRILYTVANSNAMNGIAPSTQIKHVTPWWQMAIYAVIALFAVLTAFFGYKMVKGIITWKKYKSNKMI